jgi:hypothetical protein
MKNENVKYSIFSQCSSRYQQALTLDIIMSTSFGIQTDYQTNPEDPVMEKALRAMKPSVFRQILGNIVLPLFPYGWEFLTSKVGGKIFFREMLSMRGLAQDVVDVKRRGGSTRKVGWRKEKCV